MKKSVKIELKYSLLALPGLVIGLAGILPIERLANFIGSHLPPGILQLMLIIGYLLAVLAVAVGYEAFIFASYCIAKKKNAISSPKKSTNRRNLDANGTA